jgi:hypothetical protein
VRGLLARTLRAFADEILAGLARLGGERCDILDHVPHWFLDGHRRPPAGPRAARTPTSAPSAAGSYQRILTSTFALQAT